MLTSDRIEPASNLVNNGRVIIAAPFNGQIVTTAPFLGQKLQKFGRTTGYTQGQVTAINAQITIPYGNGNALFVNQIEVVAIGSSVVFATFGDSGSLAVDFSRNPIGLLFATNGNNSFLNPFDQVLFVLVAYRLLVPGSKWRLHRDCRAQPPPARTPSRRSPATAR